MNAFICPRLKKIIRGTYGSGKTIIGKLQFECLAMQAKSDTAVYYILFDSYTIQHCAMNVYTNCLGKQSDENTIVTTTADLAREWNMQKVPVLSEVLAGLYKKHAESNTLCHIICDEVDGETITKEEAEKIRYYLTLLKESFVTVIVQSLEIRHTFIHNKRIIQRNGFQYETTGMLPITLGKSMRNSVCIYSLLSAAQSVISKTKSEFRQPDWNTTLSNTSSASRFLKPKVKFRNAEKINNDQEITEDRVVNPLPTIAPASTFDINANVPVKSSMEIAAAQRIAAQHKVKRSSNKIQTRLEYPDDLGIGHCYAGSRPRLIYLQDAKQLRTKAGKYYSSLSDEQMQVLSLSIYLKSIFHKVSPVVLCDNQQHVTLFSNALKLLDKCFVEYVPYLKDPTSFPDYALKEEAYDAFNTQKIVLTDRRGFRGMECASIIMPINPQERYERQNLVENVARCTSDIFIVVLKTYRTALKSMKSVFSKSKVTLKEVIKEWKDKDLLDVVKPDDYLCSNKDIDTMVEQLNVISMPKRTDASIMAARDALQG